MRKILCLLVGHEWSLNVDTQFSGTGKARFCTRCLQFSVLTLVDFGRHRVWVKCGKAHEKISMWRDEVES